MNFKVILNVLGKVLLLEAVLLVFPLIVGLIYNEQSVLGNEMFLYFAVPIGGLLVVGLPLSLIKPKDKTIYAREGFVIVALSWVLLSLVGAVPFVFKFIPNYADALFETVSGFTTTGASILSADKIESLPKCINFWRLFTHWIGGMGVLVFVLAILPNSGAGAIHIYKAESPGPTASKLVNKIKLTARILYLIYIVLTIVEFVFLLFDMPVFDALVHALATAGTGGFSIKGNSIGAYSAYSQWVIAVFMFIFGINFNVFYLILVGKVLKAIRGEEFITYFIIVLVATVSITLFNLFSNVRGCENFGDSLRNAFFQVTSVSSSTGFATTDFNLWPSFSKSILLFLMLFGACAGSTGGGMKISRLIILVKSAFADLRRSARPREIISVKFEGEIVNPDTIKRVRTYFVFWFIIVIISTFVLTAFGTNSGELDILSGLSGSMACIGNIGPGLGAFGPAMNYGALPIISKIWLCLVMLAGRLEILPILILFIPKLWLKK